MKKYEIEVNGELYHVSVRELTSDDSIPATENQNSSKTAPTPSTTSSNSTGAKEIHAPMSGTILKINVQTGQKVTQGETLVILEAMKMENEIVAPENGVVKDIHIQVNDRVESDQLLLTL